MKKKDKAIELVRKFTYLIGLDNLDISKRCALCCVNEILDDNPNIYDSDRLNHRYWKAVKEEIKIIE